MAHQPVLLQAVRSGLALQIGETLIDATINRAGHARVLADDLGASGHLVGIDQNEAALTEAQRYLTDCRCRVDLINGNFRRLTKLLVAIGVTEADAIFFDLGWSAEQLTESGRGFSFQTDEPLLMTLGNRTEPGRSNAREIVNRWSQKRLEQILRDYGEENFARQIAAAIATARQQRTIETTNQLVTIVREAVPLWYTHRRRHFATKTFQALRIAVNDELEALEEGLTEAWSILRPNGRLAVISFQSLEARRVKNFFREKIKTGEGKTITKKAVRAARVEVLANPRARSAELRIIKKLL